MQMKPFQITAYLKGHFSARIFLAFSALIIVISLAFTLFFYRRQVRSLTEQAVIKGELQASLLAYNAKLGVFTENPALLIEPIDGIMANKEVLSVALFNTDGKTLLSQSRSEKKPSPDVAGWNPHIVDLMASSSSLHFQTSDNFVFWSRVVLESLPPAKDDIYASSVPSKKTRQTIGYIKITMDNQFLHTALQTLLRESILICSAFLLLGSIIAYVISRKITHPLNILTSGVNAFGKEGKHQDIVIETGDEIEKLAQAFNEMVDSLRKRELEKGELEEQLRHSQKMEAIGTLAGGVAHDFNNMLTVINGYAALMKMELTGEEKLGSYANQILMAGEKAATLTSRLLAYSRKQIMNPRPLNLNEAVRNIEKMLSRLINEDIELLFRLSMDEPVVLADAGQIDQILINLATNARDAMPEGGTVTISTAKVTLDDEFVKRYAQEKGGNYALMTVSDTGIGMSEQTKEKIFDPFFTTKEVGRGTGLGLSMVYGIVKQHNGIIEADSEIGKGTTFRIYLPVVEPVMEVREASTPVWIRGNAESILVAEDDRSVMKFLKGLLENNGYSVIEADNGDEAVQKFRANKENIRLALLDVIMPRKNGRQVYEELQKIRPGTRALFLSGYTHDVIDWKDTLQEGIALISKPVQPDELLRKLREALEN
jgi:signal transduction histidine kinase/ActR/RegA family two-component response regulator